MKMSVSEYADRSPRDIFLEVVKNGVPLRREQNAGGHRQSRDVPLEPGGRDVTGQAIAVDGASPW